LKKKLSDDVNEKIKAQNNEKDLIPVILNNIKESMQVAIDGLRDNAKEAIDNLRKDIADFRVLQNEKDLAISDDIKGLHDLIHAGNNSRKENEAELFYKTEIVKKQNEKINDLIGKQNETIDKIMLLITKDNECVGGLIRDMSRLENEVGVSIRNEIKKLWFGLFGSGGIITVAMGLFVFLLKIFKIIV
jgi:hypothetical protein